MHAGCSFINLGLPTYSPSSDVVNATAVRVAGSAAVTLDTCEIRSPPPDDDSINTRGLPEQYAPTRSVASVSLGESGLVRIVNTDFNQTCQV